MNKRGQVSLFVIIGVIIVILVGLGIYYRGSIISLLGGKNAQSEAFDSNINVVKNYVDTCLYQTTEEGIYVVSLQGGYLDIPEDSSVLDGFNVMSNSLTVLPGLYVPYWYYQSANGINQNQIPSKELIEKEITKYLEQNFLSCINEFEGLSPVIVQDGTPDFDVTIHDKNVDVSTNYHLDIQQENITGKLEKFSQSINLPLGDFYDTAVQIMEKENKDTILETMTMDQFVVYDELPYSGVDFECSPKVWEQTQVIRDLKRILETNVQHLKVQGGTYKIPKEEEYYEIGDVDVPSSTSINFLYTQDWPLLIDIIPNDQILKGESYTDNALGQFILPFFCLNYYNFVYDLKYPVLISLTDDTTGYTFQFATQVIIDNNQPRQSVEVSPLNSQLSKVCEYPTTPINVNVQGYSRDGNIISIPDARVTLTCGGPTCPLGKTTSSGSLNTLAPQCLNANIRADRDGYYPRTEITNTVEAGSVNLILEPKKELNLTALVAREDGGQRGLIQGEKILIQFVHQDESFSAGALYPDQTTISLIPGTYELRTTLIKDKPEGITLEQEDVRTCIDRPASGILGFAGITKKSCTNTTLEGMTLTTVITGGTTTSFSLSRDELLRSSSLTVYTVINKEPEKVTDLQEIYSKIANNSQSPNYRSPIAQ